MMPQPNRLFWQALSAFLILPGMIGFVIPLLLRPDGARFHVAGLLFLCLGTGALLWCVRDFYVAGRGSLAPWAPPNRLVTIGLYRISRNPMYVALLLILCGWAVVFGTRTLWLYTGGMAIAFHLRVVLGEEPWLARTHGEGWRAYRARVPRWLVPTRSVDRRSARPV